MDRRRLLMNSFSENYLFREGKGFKKGVVYDLSELDETYGFADLDKIIINGAFNRRGFVLLANSIEWRKYTSNDDPGWLKLISKGLDLSKYKTLFVEMACYATQARPFSFGIIADSESPIMRDISAYFNLQANFYDTTETRRTYSLDISSVDSGTIAIRTGDNTGMRNVIYNIWLE